MAYDEQMNHVAKLAKGDRTLYLFSDGGIRRLVEPGWYRLIGTIPAEVESMRAWVRARVADGYREVNELGLPV